MVVEFTQDELGMLQAAMADYQLRGFPFKGGSRPEKQAWAALGRQTWVRLIEQVKNGSKQ